MNIREPTDTLQRQQLPQDAGRARHGPHDSMTTQAAAEWLGAPVSRPNAELRLVCFPHAGGSTANYAALARLMPETIELCPVRLPGRETRLRERPYRRAAPLVADAARELQPLFERPFALFGHSLGALLAFELTHWLREATGQQPVHLFVSGRRAPHLPDPEPPLSQLPDGPLVAELRRRYDAIPQLVLETPELLELFLPVLRADCEIIDTYACADRAPLAVPISAFGGTEDGRVGMNELDAWSRHTTGPFRARALPGDHFYFQGAEETLAAELEQDLAAIVVATRDVA